MPPDEKNFFVNGLATFKGGILNEPHIEEEHDLVKAMPLFKSLPAGRCDNLNNLERNSNSLMQK